MINHDLPVSDGRDHLGRNLLGNTAQIHRYHRRNCVLIEFTDLTKYHTTPQKKLHTRHHIDNNPPGKEERRDFGHRKCDQPRRSSAF